MGKIKKKIRKINPFTDPEFILIGYHRSKHLKFAESLEVCNLSAQEMNLVKFLYDLPCTKGFGKKLVGKWVKIFMKHARKYVAAKRSKRVCSYCGKNAYKRKSGKGGRRRKHFCGRCFSNVYCSKKCQIEHWEKQHKFNCMKSESPIFEKKVGKVVREAGGETHVLYWDNDRGGFFRIQVEIVKN